MFLFRASERYASSCSPSDVSTGALVFGEAFAGGVLTMGVLHALHRTRLLGMMGPRSKRVMVSEGTMTRDWAQPPGRLFARLIRIEIDPKCTPVGED